MGTILMFLGVSVCGGVVLAGCVVFALICSFFQNTEVKVEDRN